MKKIRLIPILSLLLCLVLIASACAPAPEDVTPPVEEEKAVTAEPIRSNFVTEKFEPVNKLKISKNLTEAYGSLCDNTDNLLVFLKQTKDYMNNMTEIYTVYSVTDAAVVKTFTHTYPDEAYGREDDYGNIVLPEKEFYVSVDLVGYYSGSVDYISAVTVTNTPIDGLIIEDNDLQLSYSKSYVTEFYDAKGAFIASTPVAIVPANVESNNYTLTASFGKTVAVFDIYENKMVDSYNGDVANKNNDYDAKNDKYTYYLGVPYGTISNNYATDYTGAKIQVYGNDDGKLVCEYVYSDVANATNTIVLENGDIMIQNAYYTEGNEYDVYTAGTKIDLQTLLLDVETGKVTEVEFNYMFIYTLTRDELVRSLEANINSPHKVEINAENVKNMGIGMRIENGVIVTAEYDGVYFDNLLNVNYVEEKVCFEQDLLEESRPLNNGYYYVTLHNVVTPQAIVNNGEIVAYLPADAVVTDYGIVLEDTVYNFEMELVYDINASSSRNYIYQTSLGKYAIFYSCTDEYVDEYTTTTRINVVYVDVTTGEKYSTSDSSIVDTGDGNYIVAYNSETEKYRLYNTAFECILSGDAIGVLVIEDQYIVNLVTGDNEYVFVMTASGDSDGYYTMW